MTEQVLILANPQGVDAVTIGKDGTIVKRFFTFSLIQFINEFGESEEWYFDHTEYKTI
jgi:hypothetical protein